MLQRLSSSDAHVLSQIAEQEKDKSVAFKKALKRFAVSFSMAGVAIELIHPDEKGSFIHEHLSHLHLVRKSDGMWSLTLTGKAFIQAVSDSWEENV